jgi:N-acetylmuramoyl-L-alanine amidase
MRILIDPGHGSRDPGAQGNGLTEKDLTIVLAIRTEERLDNYDCHCEIYQHHNVSGMEDMDSVIKHANEGNFDFFLSLHVNSAADAKATGFESFRYPGEDPAPQKAIHAAVAEYVRLNGIGDRGMKEENFKVLRETKMPAVLLECGFISAPNDSAKLKDYKFVDKLANAIAWGVVQAFNLKLKQSVKDCDNCRELQQAREQFNAAKQMLSDFSIRAAKYVIK